MSDLNPYPIDPFEFDAFLQAQDLHSVAGIACDDTDCPLSRFLNAMYPDSTFAVNMTEYRRIMDDISLGVEPADVVLPLDAWAQDFAWLVDLFADFEEGVSITVLDALFLLHAVMPRQGVLHD